MKILQVFHHYKPYRGGVEKVIEKLNKNLKAKGFECSVLCLDRNPGSSERLPARQRFDEALVERIPFLDMGYYKLAPFSLKKLQGFDIVHVHGLGYFSDKLAVTKLFHRKKLVLSTHGGIFHTKRLGLLKWLYFFGWCRIALKAFDKVIAVSKADYELFEKIVPEKKLVLIENPVEIEGVSSKRSPVPNSFLFVGRLSRNKGLRQMLEAFAEVKGRGIDFSLVIAGKEFDFGREELEKMAMELGLGKQVSVLGEVSEKRLLQLYRENEFFASASQYEGFGISAVEAMAAGLVPILNSIAPFRGFVKNGENGFIADFGNAEKAADVIEQALRLSSIGKKRFGDSARVSAKRFSWQNCIGRFEKLYKALLENSKKRKTG